MAGTITWVAVMIFSQADGTIVGAASPHDSQDVCIRDARSTMDQAPLLGLGVKAGGCKTAADSKILLDSYGCKFEYIGEHGVFLYTCRTLKKGI